jgi:hypothetical protein
MMPKTTFLAGKKGLVVGIANNSRAGFVRAMNVSIHSLIRTVRLADVAWARVSVST